MRKFMNKHDILILIISLGAALGLSALFFFVRQNAPAGSAARISADAVVAGEWLLSEDVTNLDIFSRNGMNVLEIKDGYIRMIHADCLDLSCVRQGGINRVGQYIVCLPNRVVVEITGGNSDTDIDAVTK
jgi:hypothetical protein